MEGAAATTSSLLLFSTTPRRSSLSSLPSPSFLRPSPCNYSCSAVSSAKQQHLALPWLINSKRSSNLMRRSSNLADGASTVRSSVRWVLEPAGDGDWHHIGYKVARPGAIEIAQDAPVTVGRVADKADIVLPVATVSGMHARLETKDDGRLLVTDLDSTNGTYINERRLNPGFPIPVDPGSFVIFGDIHLAMFRVRKMTTMAADQEVTSSDTQQGAAAQQEETNKAAEVAVSAAASQDTTTS